MTLQPESELREIAGVTTEQKGAIEHFMQDAIYCWIKNQKGKSFAVRDLMGGDNFNWNGTPLQVLYDYQESLGKGHEAAVDAAGIALGWIVKGLLHKDQRVFKSIAGERVAHYKWIEL